jgi:hypothetical protein
LWFGGYVLLFLEEPAAIVFRIDPYAYFYREDAGYYETLVAVYETTQRHIPESFNSNTAMRYLYLRFSLVSSVNIIHIYNSMELSPP